MSGPSAGDLIDIWDAGEIVSGVVLGAEKGRLRVVTERGEEIRIVESRIAHRPARAAPVDPKRGAQAAAAHAEEAKRLAAEVDVASLWDLLVDEGGRHTVQDLSTLALGKPTAERTSALVRRLTSERIHFDRKGDLWEARGREVVEQTRQRLRAEAQKTRRREEFLGRMRERLRAGSAAPCAADPLHPEDASFLAMLTGLAVHGDEAPDRKEAISLLEDLGVTGHTPSGGAFDLLVRAGVFSADENLEVRRFALRTAFPEEVEHAARRAVTRPPEGSRRDLTGLPAVTVDDEETVEIDDALSWEDRGGGAASIGIHISDPAHFIAPGDPVDEEALKRAATYYLPEVRLPMMPSSISEEAASLVPGHPRPALSFLVEVDSEGRVAGFEIVPSMVLSRRRMTYDEADEILSTAGSASDPIGTALKALENHARKLESERVAAGALVIRTPEVVVKVGADGTIRLKRIEERGPSRRLVSEMMILANQIAARFCVERKIPAIYRRQPPPERRPDPIPEGPYDPVAVRAVRRALRRGEVCLAPDGHYALGVPAYTQVTSPLRRYQDLAMQRQIEASLRCEPLPYDMEAMARIAASTEEAEKAARQAEAGADAYFILKYLAARIGGSVDVVILAVEPRRTEVEIEETLTTGIIAPRPDHVPGARVRAVIEAVRPRDGILRLRQVDAVAAPG